MAANFGVVCSEMYAEILHQTMVHECEKPRVQRRRGARAEQNRRTVAALVGRSQALTISSHVSFPPADSLWAETMYWACDAQNYAATSANPANKSACER